MFDMRSTLIFILTACMFSLNASGQTNPYNSLLDTAIKFTGQLFVSAEPITHINIHEDELWHYADYFKDISNSKLDTIMLLQIIRNCTNVDTALWLDSELDKFILVKTKDEKVDIKYVVDKFKLTNKKQIKYYKMEINKFNSTSSFDKNINFYSRPVFDNSEQFAIIQWDNGHSGLSGGGGITLYQFNGSVWTELGNIILWKH